MVKFPIIQVWSCATGIYSNNSDAEIINTEVFKNSGTGITCVGSSPDLDTYNITEATEYPNEIRDNGPASPSGSNGAEIYLDVFSTPVIKYNNIFHCESLPFSTYGYAIYMDDINLFEITATSNWWGTDEPDEYESDLFYEGGAASLILPRSTVLTLLLTMMNSLLE